MCYVFLGGVQPHGIKFRAPGADHHARWMSKAIYCLKIYIFQEQFTLKARENNGLREICIFLVMFYVRAWFTAPSAIKAPYQDLTFIQRLVTNLSQQTKDRIIDEKISRAAAYKFEGHLWYLSEELAALAFFDDAVPFEMKSKMANSIKKKTSVRFLARKD